jgi:replicative DNA helicase
MSSDDIRNAVPHAIDAEQSVLGALILDNDSIDRMGDLRAEDFFVADHRAIFASIMRALEAGKPVDVLTLADALPTVSAAYLHSLAANTPSSANIARYAAIVRDRSIRRGLLSLSADMSERAMSDRTAEALSLIEDAQRRLDAMADAGDDAEPVKASEDMGAYVDVLEARRAGVSAGMSTGFPDLDRMLSGGLRRGEVVLIAARPKVGKTGLALAIARNIAETANVLLLEMEMPRAQLHDRNMAALARISLGKLLDPNRLDDDDWRRVTAALGRIETLGLYVDDKAGLRMIDVRNKARRIKRRHGLDLLVIDYLQLMEADGDNRNAQIESITRGIKVLAKELNIAVLLLSQLNREVEKRQDKRPLPSDLRDSGSIEQDCDVGLFLYRDEIYREDSLDAGIVEVNVGLNRHGSTGTIGLHYIGDQARFESLDAGVVFGRKRPVERKHGYSGLRD